MTFTPRLNKRYSDPEFNKVMESMTDEQLDAACGLASDAISDTTDVTILGISGGMILGWAGWKLFDFIKGKIRK